MWSSSPDGGGPSGVDHVFAISRASNGTGSVVWSARPIGGVSGGRGWGESCLHVSPDLNTVLDGPASDGTTRVLWDGRGADGRSVPAGIYMGRLSADGRIISTRSAVRLSQ